VADRFLVSEVQQVGVESTAGTAVAPTVQLNGLNFEIDTDLEVAEFGPSGMLPMTIVAPIQEWSSGQLTGYPTYTELPYPLSNVLGAATITTPTGATLGRRWLWEPDESTPWTPKTLTLRRGVSGDTAEEANYVLMSGLGLTFSRTSAPELSGDLFARRLDYAATLAATGVNQHSLVPILPSQCDVYLDSASGSLGVTKLLRDFEFSWSISGLYDMIWPLNSSLTSFAAHAVVKPTLEAMLRLGNDTVGRALTSNMRAGSTVWVRFRATGETNSIESGQTYRLTIDVPLKVFAAPSRADENGLSTLEWTFRNVYDPAWGKWISIELITNFAVLGTP
jgi:hypothetical protein